MFLAPTYLTFHAFFPHINQGVEVAFHLGLGREPQDVPTMSINSVGPLLALAFPERVARQGDLERA